MCYRVRQARAACTPEAPETTLVACQREADCGGTPRQTSLCRRQERFQPVEGLYLNNQIGPERLDALLEQELCVPAAIIGP